MNYPLIEQIASRSNKYKFNKSTNKHYQEAFVGFGVDEPRSKSQRVYVSSVAFSLLVFGFMLVLLAKTYSLQIISGEDNRMLAEGNRVRVANIEAERGLILDTNGEVLARNTPAFSLVLSTDFCSPDCKQIVRAFSDEIKKHNTSFNVDLSYIYDKIENGASTVILSSDISKDESILFESMLHKYPSFTIVVAPKRQYLYNESFAHLIGYVGYAEVAEPLIEGKEGVEASYDDYVRGIPGGEVMQVNSLGKKIAVLSKKRAQPGKDIQLYVIKDLQLLAYDLLRDVVENTQATGGAIVAQDPRNGGILALVSYPSFDSNKLSTGIAQIEYEKILRDERFPFFNRVVSAAYPPASTFKLVMAAAVLMEDIVGEYYQIMDNGFIQIGSFTYKGWKDGGHGLVDLRRAIQVSNDVYFYITGGGYGGVSGLGIKKIASWASKFGYGQKLGVDLPGEVSGFIPDGTHREWYLGDTYISSIGQGDILATPLQVNAVTSYFANGGYIFEPQAAQSITGQLTDTQVISQSIVDEATYNTVREGMKMAVEYGGTGYPLFDFYDKHGVKLAGKTGTAEFGLTNSDETHAWFTVFGPYEEAEIVLTIFLENGGSGSHDAAPIARSLLDLYFLQQLN